MTSFPFSPDSSPRDFISGAASAADCSKSPEAGELLKIARRGGFVAPLGGFQRVVIGDPFGLDRSRKAEHDGATESLG
jgi:hypothetical protein